MENELLIAILSSQVVLIIIQGVWKFFGNVRSKYYEGISHSFAEAKIELNAKVEALRDSVGAQRVCVNIFHNGGQYYTGESIKKMSVVAEAVEQGEIPIREENQNIPVGAHLRNIRPLFNSEYLFEKNTQTQGDILSQLYDTLDVKTCLCMPVFKRKPWYWIGKYPKRMIAYIQVSWREETELTSEIKNLAFYHKETIDLSLIDLASKK